MYTAYLVICTGIRVNDGYIGFLESIDASVCGRGEALVVDLPPAADGQVGEQLRVQLGRRQADRAHVRAENESSGIFAKNMVRLYMRLVFLKKLGQPRPLFHLFSVFTNKQHYNFYNRSM